MVFALFALYLSSLWSDLRSEHEHELVIAGAPAMVLVEFTLCEKEELSANVVLKENFSKCFFSML